MDAPISAVMLAVETSSDARTLGLRALAGGLCVAGVVGVLALLAGGFGPGHTRIIATSFGFGFFSLTASTGAALRVREQRWAEALGSAAVVSSATAFLLLVVLLWITPPTRSVVEALIRAGVLALVVALWSSHACVVLGARSERDSPAVRAATLVALVAFACDALAASLFAVGVLDPEHTDPVGLRALAAVLVTALVSTALIPILRRLAAGSARAEPQLPAVAALAPDRATARGPTAALAVATAVAGLVLGVVIGGSSTREARTVTVISPYPAAVSAPYPAAASPPVPVSALREAESRLVRARGAGLRPGWRVFATCLADSPPEVACHSTRIAPGAAATAGVSYRRGRYDVELHRVVFSTGASTQRR